MNQSNIKLLHDSPQLHNVKAVYHLAYYHALRVGYQEKISKLVHDFRDGVEPQTSRWIELAAKLLHKEIGFDIIVRALGSGETVHAERTPLDRLCKTIAKESGATYAPDRLQKTKKTKSLNDLGGKAARQKELADVYRFSDTGLQEGVRILVVDDILTTGSTLEAIACAIDASRKDAEISCFVLAKVDGRQPNTHLDAEYFTSGGASQGKKGRQQKSSPVRPPARNTPGLKQKSKTPGKSPTAGNWNAKSNTWISTAVSDARRKGGGTQFYVAALVLALVLLGAIVQFRPRNEINLQTDGLAQLITDHEAKPPEPAPVPDTQPVRPEPAAKKVVSTLPQGIVTVPNVGLRADHRLDAKVLPKSRVRNGAMVELLKKYSPDTGPNWIQIRTPAGQVGWVLASVVRHKSR